MYNFEKLEVWQKCRSFVNAIYVTTGKYPKEHMFGLAHHTQRSAVSTLSNIAEGTSRRSRTDFQRFLEISLGSLYETITQLFIAFDNNFITEEDFKNLYDESESIAKMISSLSGSLKDTKFNL